MADGKCEKRKRTSMTWKAVNWWNWKKCSEEYCLNKRSTDKLFKVGLHLWRKQKLTRERISDLSR